MDSLNNQTISSFFANKTVFLTGATGFVGRATIEKLLRACPEVNKIYVLVRGKKGKSGEERMKEIFEAMLFQRVREINPDLFKKVITVDGDVTIDEELGIRPDEAETLREEVSIILHSAAITNFAAGFENLLKSNVGGPKNMIAWAKKIKNLEVFVHLSTAFSNSHLHPMEFEEKVYTSKINPHFALKFYSNLPADLMESIQPTLIGRHVSIYTFSKYLGETVIQEAQHDLPICIVRPAIIGPAHQEPYPSWIDNVTGFFQGALSMTRGLVRVFYTNKYGTVDIVPIDHVVNLTLAASMCRALDMMKTEDILVFNCSASDNPFIDVRDQIMEAVQQVPLDKIIWYPSVAFAGSDLSFKILDFFLHYVPALLLDGVFAVTGRRPKVGLVATYHRMKKLMEHTLKLTRLEYKLSTDNTKALFKRLTPKDQEAFNFNNASIDQNEYIRNGAYGFRRYAYGQKDEDIPQARENLQRLYRYYVASWAFLAVVIALLLWVLL